MNKVSIEKINEVNLRVFGPKEFEIQLRNSLTFKVPGYQFMPAHKKFGWNGNIQLYNPKTRLVYTGLLARIQEFAAEKGYETTGYEGLSFNFSEHEGSVFADALGLPFKPRDYQIKALAECVRDPRSLILMPTGSGKSLVIYMVSRYYAQKTLLIVPTLNLIHQMASDFKDYGYSEQVSQIYSGKDKDNLADITVSTWQSIHKLGPGFFDQFGMVIVDECHLATAKSITSILEKMPRCPIRLGFTGSLSGAKTNQLVLEGLFGQPKRIVTTNDLIKKKHLADFKINAILLKHDNCPKMDYQTELEYIVSNEKRNEFIKNLVLSLRDNTLVLFQFVEKHGKPLYEMIKAATDRPVYFIHGGVDGKEREKIRHIVNQKDNAIIIGSNQTVSTGINIPTLKNIIFTSPSKSRVRTLQSIGRVLRKASNKTNAQLFDIADDASYGKKETKERNITLNHFIERLRIYKQEQFPVKVFTITLDKKGND